MDRRLKEKMIQTSAVIIKAGWSGPMVVSSASHAPPPQNVWWSHSDSLTWQPMIMNGVFIT